jgi:hypothetical protein
MAIMADFRQFNFGYADSINEFQLAPRLLREGYYDLGGVEDKVINSHEFLLLGYKGSGKSAVGARLRILAEGAPAQYAAPPPILVDKLPLGEFRGIVPDSFDAETRHRHAWTLHFLVGIVTSLAKDGQADQDSRKSVEAVVKQLSRAGVTPKSPSSMKWFRTNKVTTTAGFNGIASVSAEFQRQTDASSLGDWISYLEDATSKFSSPRRHFFFVDGLDDLSLVRDGRNALLGGLIQAAVDLNSLYRASGSPIKIVVCCRTDLYSRLKLSSSGKIRRDFGLELNWYQNPRSLEESHLVQLANKRARLSNSGTVNIFTEHFEPRISSTRAAEFILLQTRHTPRDLLQLLKVIQKHVSAPGVIPENTALAGMAEYSRTYFIDEMRDALGTYFDAECLTRIIDLLGTLRRRRFTYGEIQQRVAGDVRFKDYIDLHEMLTALFDTSFIGNVTEGGPTGSSDA